jgi:prepilin-type processing-associated H-X9-DG protein
MLLVVAVVLLPALKSAREQARRAQCLANIKQFALAWTMYLEDEHPEQFRTLDDLKPYAKDLKIFVCPSAKDQLHTSYEIVGITNLWQDNPDAVVIREIEPNHAGGRNVLYNDGHAQWQPDRL